MLTMNKEDYLNEDGSINVELAKRDGLMDSNELLTELGLSIFKTGVLTGENIILKKDPIDLPQPEDL